MVGSQTLTLAIFCTSRRFLLAAPRPRFFIVDGGVKKAEDADGDASSICRTLAVLLDLLRIGVGGALLVDGVDAALLASSNSSLGFFADCCSTKSYTCISSSSP